LILELLNFNLIIELDPNENINFKFNYNNNNNNRIHTSFNKKYWQFMYTKTLN